jgi:trans-aconitate 2-methyltransferase
VSRREWDAETYHQVSAPQQAWAQEQFARIGELRGDEVILDAGCGSGKVTAQLSALVPDGRVYGVDASQQMAEHAAAQLAEKATILCQDLVELELPEQVDLIFSNATFHWIPDHERLFQRLFATLKPGGRLVAQCGGKGNIDSFRRIAEEVAGRAPFDALPPVKPWTYEDPEITARRLSAAGFVEVETWLEPRPTTLEDPRPFITTVCLLPYLSQLPEELREPYIDAVLEQTGVPLTLDYVRLNMVARKT